MPFKYKLTLTLIFSIAFLSEAFIFNPIPIFLASKMNCFNSLRKKIDSTNSTTFVGNQFQQDGLNRHNEYRAKHGSPNLILDKDVCFIYFFQ